MARSIADVGTDTALGAGATAPLGGHRAVLEGLRVLAARGGDGVLAVVVETSGSTYRKPGALILLDADGVRAGALSGGCLEGELEDAARAVLAGGVAGEARFDTSGDEDRLFGSGTGCGGSMRVLLLRVPARAAPLRDALGAADAERSTLTLSLQDVPGPLGAGEARFGTRRFRFDRRGRAADGGAATAAAIEVEVRAAPRLLLFGAGPETAPLLRLTRLLGWHAELVEHRRRWLAFADGTGVDRRHVDGLDALPALDAARCDAALVMHHNFDLDARALRRLAPTAIGYVGLLGPAARRDELLAELGADGTAALQPRLHAPVGLPLGGEGAEAVALAIAAELAQRFAA